MRRYDRPATIKVCPANASTQAGLRGKRCSVSAVTLNVTATGAGNLQVNFKDGGSSGTQRWIGGVSGATIGNTAHFSFPDGMKFEDGVSVGCPAGCDAYIAVLDVSEGI